MGTQLGGRTIVVEKTAQNKGQGKGKSKDKDTGPSLEACIKGFSPTTSDDDIRQLFTPCGEVNTVRIPKNEDGEPKGVAFITFKTEDALAKAVELNNTQLGGRTIVVEKAAQNKGQGKGKSKDKDKNGKGKGKDGKGKGKGKNKAKGKSKR